MSSYIPKTSDEKARCSIIDDINTNLFVEAGAGSGKTTMLVNRMVAMIESGIPVDKICAITFTKNAALEFYQRFQAKLIERIHPDNDKEPEHAGDLDKPTDEARERCKKALEDIDLCFMGTIDSFCNMVLSEHPNEAKIPSNTRLISNDEASAIYKKFYVDIRKGKYTQKLQELSERFAIFFRNPEEMFSSLIGEIMDRRNVTFVYNDNLCVDIDDCFAKQMEDLKQALNKFALDTSKITLSLKDQTLNPIAQFNDCNITIQRGLKYNYSGVQNALKVIKDLIYCDSQINLGLIKNTVVADTCGTAMTKLNIADPDNPSALLFKLQEYKYQNTLRFLIECTKPLSELMRQEGKFTFFDYLIYLRDMIVEDSKKEGKLIEYIYNRHSYFLIDEFQDTNPVQAEVFFYLAAKDPKQDSWKKCKPKDGALFIVGDPKQSIYRFRNADVSSYIGIRKLFEDNIENSEVKYLVNNFRSKNEVKKFFNDVFNEVLSDDNDPEQSKYKDIDNLNSPEDEKEFKGIYKYQCYSGKLLEEDKTMDDCEQIAKVILSIMNSDKKIIDEDKKSATYKQLRKIRLSDFMVIFNKKGPISSCIETFKKYKIAARVEGKVLFEESDALKAITSIYKTVTTRNDTISLVETLKCPIFGYSDNDLSEYKNNGNEIRLELSKIYGQKGIEKTFNRLLETSKCISSQTPSSLFEKIIDDYEIFKYISSESLEIVYYVLELLRNEEHSGNIITYEDAINYLNELISGESEQERCLSLKQGIDAVHVANLHKIKGLEAPIVILAKAGVNNAPSAGIRIEYYDDPATNKTLTDGYVCSMSDPDSTMFKAIETKSIQDKHDKEVESFKKEFKRQVYVAATRAKNVLIINEVLQKRGKDIKPYPSSNKWGSLLGKCKANIFDVVSRNFTPVTEKGPEMQATNIYANVELTKLTSDKSHIVKQPSDIKTSPKTVETPTYEDTEINDESKLLGTIIHRLMEMIIMSNNNIQKEELISNVLDEYITNEFNGKAAKYKKILSSVFDTMNSGGYPQKNGITQNILNEILVAQKKYSEIPFSYRNEDNEIWSGIIDVLYVKNDKAYIVDWKTNNDDSNLDERYKDQLNAYKIAVKEILGLDVESAMTYHIDLTTDGVSNSGC